MQMYLQEAAAAPGVKISSQAIPERDHNRRVVNDAPVHHNGADGAYVTLLMTIEMIREYCIQNHKPFPRGNWCIMVIDL